MLSTKLACLALLLSALALGYVVFESPAPTRANGPGRTAHAPNMKVNAALDSLSLQMDSIREQLEELQLRGDLDSASLRVPAGSEGSGPAAAGERLQAIEERLMDLEGLERRTLHATVQQEQELEQTRQMSLVEREEAIRLEREELRQMVVDWTEQARDPSNSVAIRLQALKGLRGNHLANGLNARVPLVAEMVHLAQSNDQGSTRATVWRHLDGVVDPVLRTALLDALATDLYPDAREVAAESLEHYLPDSIVEAALRNAMKYDGDEGVQKQAEKSLASITR